MFDDIATKLYHWKIYIDSILDREKHTSCISNQNDNYAFPQNYKFVLERISTNIKLYTTNTRN